MTRKTPKPPETEMSPMGAASVARFRRTRQPMHLLAVALSDEDIDALPRHVRAPWARVERMTLAALDGGVLERPPAPELVLSPLVAPGFDCMDLLITLREARYGGRYLVLSDCLPHIPLIRTEMRAVAGDLDVDIIALGAGSVLHVA